MKKNDLPIGIYDSGVGGVSVLCEAMKCLPHENFLYYGDSKHAPYGTKSEEEIKELSLKCGEFLFNQGVKMIVIACNTATSIVVQTMRERYNIPIISIEPAVKPALLERRQGRIIVLATPATLKQKRYHTLLDNLDAQDIVINVECARLADLIEKGNVADPHIKAYIHDKLVAYRGQAVDGIVIGCTHYSFVADKIKDIAAKMFPSFLDVYDGRYGTARHIVHVLDFENLRNGQNTDGTIEFFTSGNDDSLSVYRYFLSLL